MGVDKKWDQSVEYLLLSTSCRKIESNSPVLEAVATTYLEQYFTADATLDIDQRTK